MSERVLVSTWEGLIKNSEGEAEIHELHKYSHTEEVVYPLAVPARITPSKRKPLERPYDTLLVFSDAHIGYRRVIDGETNESALIPLHDEKALGVVRQLARAIRPNIIIDLGDTVDLSELSRFPADSDHFHSTLGPTFQRVHDFYAELRADNPDAQIISIEGNHNNRLKKFLVKNSPQLLTLRRAGEEYPVNSFPFLANLGHIGVKYVSGYPSGEFVYKDIVFHHGTVASKGSTAARVLPYLETTTVQGHAHRAEMLFKTNRAGKYIGSIVVGALASPRGEVPSFRSGVSDLNHTIPLRENWQQSVLLIRDHDGEYEFNQIMINNGRAYHEGKTYE